MNYPNEHFDSSYHRHRIFNVLVDIKEIYDVFSFLASQYLNSQRYMIVNFDSYIYSSMMGTIESIESTLKRGRLGDAFALLRKLHDASTLNIYVNLFIDENAESSGIEKWLKGEVKLEHNTFKRMSQYINKSVRLRFILDYFLEKSTFKELRKRGNDHIHLNYFDNFLNNDNTLAFINKATLLDHFVEDLENIFALHFSCISILREHYMCASDYIDALECGLQPEPDSQYWVSPPIQKIFTEFIEKENPKVAAFIKENVAMHLR